MDQIRKYALILKFLISKPRKEFKSFLLHLGYYPKFINNVDKLTNNRLKNGE